jgi:hypothetical protein
MVLWSASCVDGVRAPIRIVFIQTLFSALSCIIFGLAHFNDSSGAKQTSAVIFTFAHYAHLLRFMPTQNSIEPFQKTSTPSDLSAIARYPPDHCAICLEPISERAITAPCNHALFDYLCLLTWLLDHDAKCPLCM